MKKTKLLIVILAIIVVTISLAILVLRVLSKPEYTLEEMDAYINKSIPNNVYYKRELFNSKNNLDYITEIYVKDEKTYVHIKDFKRSTDEEFLCDYKNNTEIRVDHNEKIFVMYLANNNGYFLKNPLYYEIRAYKMFFYNKYKYLGVQALDGKEHMKILLYSRYNRLYMYINQEDRRISKVEVYSRYDENDVKQHKYILNCTDIFSYSYDTVTDEDIPEFDINNYPNYNLIDFINPEE